MTPPDANVEGRKADATAASAALPRLAVLKKRAEFLSAARARRQGTAGFMLQARERGTDENDGGIRVGFTCSRKVGNAVTRNRAKRRLRALAAQVLPRLGHPGWDYVLVGRPGATVDRPFAALLDDLEGALHSIHKPRGPRP